MLATLENNATRATAAFQMAHSAVAVVSPTVEGGIQHDGSFHQHGAQLYSGWGYGGIYSTNVLVRAGACARLGLGGASRRLTLAPLVPRALGVGCRALGVG